VTSKQKLIYLGVIPLASAGIGGVATYYAAPQEQEQIVITGDAAKAAKNGKLTIELIRRDKNETDHSWMRFFAFPLLLVGLAAMLWAGARN